MQMIKLGEDERIEPRAAIDQITYRAAMRRFLGGAVIVTTGNLSAPLGITATSVVSLSVDPPSLIACISKTASAHDVILRCGAFAVNGLGAHHVDLAERFSGRDGLKGSARFRYGKWIELSTGSPILHDASASFDCTLRAVFDGGTHSIFIGDVVAVRQAERGTPLTYWCGEYGSIASRR